MLPNGGAGHKAIRILSEQEVSLLDIDEIDRVGEKLRIQEKSMGKLPTDMYLGVDDFYGLPAMLMLLRAAPVAFAVQPTFYMDEKLSPNTWSRERCQRTRGNDILEHHYRLCSHGVRGSYGYPRHRQLGCIRAIQRFRQDQQQAIAEVYDHVDR